VIPDFEPATGNCPPGEHLATWDEVVTRFGHTEWRRALLAGLREALLALRAAGCERLYLDGSFVTAKQRPGDFDACWDADGVDFDLLDPVLLTFDRGRATQKAKYGGELFLADAGADPMGTLFLEFFQADRDGIQRELLLSI
jgi:hypothetical protein